MAFDFEKVKQEIKTKVVDPFVNKVTDDIRRNAPTRNIVATTEISPARVDGGAIRAKIIISAPEAPAYEYGSGEHGEKGEKYPIRARNYPSMIFDWKPPDGEYPGADLDWIKIYTYDPISGRVKFDYPREVWHPGVEARPFIRPAIDKNVRGIKKLLLKTIKAEIRVSFERK